MQQPSEPDRILDRRVDAERVPRMTNCRLRRTRERLLFLLNMVEEEMDGRIARAGLKEERK